MKLNLEIVKVEGPNDKRNTKGGVYKVLNVIYKKDGKVEAKTFADFANEKIWDTLLSLKEGQAITAVSEKVNGYWNWTDIMDGTSTDQGAASEASASSGSPMQARTGKVLGSNYETPEERSARQRCIVAQSSISSAIEVLKAENPKGAIDRQQVCVIADMIYGYVMEKAQWPEKE